jgi:hypothetical protein
VGVVLVVAVLAVAVLGGWFVVRRGDVATDGTVPVAVDPRHEPRPSPSVGEESPAATAATPAGDVASEPDGYARAIAQLVFAVDTRDGSSDELRSVLLGEADPRLSSTGREDLVRLLAVRLPDDGQWARMAANQQWAEWRATDVHEPGTFAEMVVEGHSGAGWAMRNVTGIQTVHYRDGGQWRESARERTVTVAMRCPLPDSAVTDLDRCRLLLVPPTVVP